MINVKGMRKPGIPSAIWIRLLARVRDLCTPTVAVVDGDARYLFRCPTPRTLKRASTLFVKETGTIDWLRNSLRPGDVFLDIGANVGVYSIYAAHLVGPSGHVYAVEPHVFNAATLLDNIHLNGLSDRISVLTMALSAKSAYDDFFYNEFDIGVANNAFGTERAAQRSGFVGSELKYATTVDELVRQGAIRSPDLVKIDVDGLEPDIVAGMSELLSGPKRPRSVQIEVDPDQRDAVESVVASLRYDLDHRHYTMNGKKRLKQGIPEREVMHNAVYTPGTA